MKILNKFFDKVIIFEIKKFKDKRGGIFETFNQRFSKKKNLILMLSQLIKKRI